MAGWVGERLLLPLQKVKRGGTDWKKFYAIAKAHIARHGGKVLDFLSLCEAKAEQAIRRHWHSFIDLVGKLCRCGVLSEEEIESAMKAKPLSRHYVFVI